MAGLHIPWRVATGLVVLGLISSACGGTGGGTTSPSGGGTNTPAGGAHTPAGGGGASAVLTFTATVALTGESPVMGTYTDTSTVTKALASSCMTYASNGLFGGNGFVVPKPVDATPVGGQPLTLAVAIAGTKFHGYGDYPASETIMTIQIGNNTYQNNGNSNYSADVSVAGDGGGTLALTNLPNGLGSGTESGTITWTCQ